MFIELLVVAVVISFLYTSGFVQFDSGYAVAISLVVVLLAAGVSFFITHILARTQVDKMFGFGSWSPRGDNRPKQALTPQEAAGLDSSSESELQRLLRAHPSDLEVSRRVSEIYLKRGLTDLFVAERLRLVETKKLTREQICTIYNRVADVMAREGKRDEAIQYLQQVVIRFPGTVEAGNAQRRCELLEAGDTEEIVSNTRA